MMILKKILKLKKCKSCGDKFEPIRTLQIACSMQCAIDLVNKQKEKIVEAVLSPQETKVENSESNSLSFIILLVMLTVATLLVYDYKIGGKLRLWTLSHFSNKTEVVEKVENKKPVESDSSKMKEEFDKFVAAHKGQLDALQNKVGSIRDKVMLMGLLLNENFNIIKQNEDKDEMVFFNSDWTLNKMPTHIDLSDEDKEYLKKYVK